MAVLWLATALSPWRQETIDNSGCGQCTVFVTNPVAGTVTKVVFSSSGVMQTVIATGMTSAEAIVCGPDENLYIARSGVYGGPSGISTIDQYGWADGNIPFSRISALASSGDQEGLPSKRLLGQCSLPPRSQTGSRTRVSGT